MATRNATPAARQRRDDLVVDDSHARWTRYEGTQSTLIERAGIPVAAFDEANRRTKHVWTSQHGDRSIEVRRKSPQRFLAYVTYTPAEQERREAERAARRKAEQERENARQTIASWPTDPTSWRAALVRSAELMLSFVDRDASGGFYPGFRLDSDALDELSVHLQAIRGLIETGTVVPDPAGRAKREEQLRARVVAADPGLARFLAAAGVPGGASA